jgi:ribonuclease Z
MKLVLLGTGCPVASLRRQGPAQIVECGDDSVLVDCGAGTLRRLMEAGFEGKVITYVALTHLHSDHVTGLLDVLYAGWVRRKPPTIVGPPGTQHLVSHLVESMAYDTRIRGGEARRWSIDVIEVEEGWHISGNDWQLEAFRVDHQPVDQAFGYRFDQGAASLVISGDTKPCENLITHAKGSSLLLHEAYLNRGMERDLAGATGEAERSRFELLRFYHTSSREVGAIAARAEVGQLVLSHIYVGRSWPDEPEHFLEDVRPAFKAAVVGEDLMTFSV